MRWLGDIIGLMDMSLSKLWEIVRVRETWCAAVLGVTKNWTQFSDWTTTCLCVYKNINTYLSIFKNLNDFLSLSRLLQVSTSMTWSSLKINNNKALFARHFMLSIQQELSSLNHHSYSVWFKAVHTHLQTKKLRTDQGFRRNMW